MIYNRRGAGILFSVAPRRKDKKTKKTLYFSVVFLSTPKIQWKRKRQKKKKTKKWVLLIIITKVRLLYNIYIGI